MLNGLHPFILNIFFLKGTFKFPPFYMQLEQFWMCHLEINIILDQFQKKKILVLLLCVLDDITSISQNAVSYSSGYYLLSTPKR